MTVYAEIQEERDRQDEVWGTDNRDAFVLATVLAEECGEVARAVHDVTFGADLFGDEDSPMRALEAVRAEAIQVAAVAVQIVERLDAGTMVW